MTASADNPPVQLIDRRTWIMAFAIAIPGGFLITLWWPRSPEAIAILALIGIAVAIVHELSALITIRHLLTVDVIAEMFDARLRETLTRFGHSPVNVIRSKSEPGTNPSDTPVSYQAGEEIESYLDVLRRQYGEFRESERGSDYDVRPRYAADVALVVANMYFMASQRWALLESKHLSSRQMILEAAYDPLFSVRRGERMRRLSSYKEAAAAASVLLSPADIMRLDDLLRRAINDVAADFKLPETVVLARVCALYGEFLGAEK
jgi:hypothetical protein